MGEILGLYQKYNITRTDGQSDPGCKHDGCEYFVLDLTHDRHAVSALRAYARSCEAGYPQLAHDLRGIAGKLEDKRLEEVHARSRSDPLVFRLETLGAFEMSPMQMCELGQKALEEIKSLRKQVAELKDAVPHD